MTNILIFKKLCEAYLHTYHHTTYFFKLSEMECMLRESSVKSSVSCPRLGSQKNASVLGKQKVSGGSNRSYLVKTLNLVYYLHFHFLLNLGWYVIRLVLNFFL